MRRPNGNIIDTAICEEINKLSVDSTEFICALERGQAELLGNSQDHEEQLERLRKSYQQKDNEISALVTTMSKAAGTAAEEYIIRQIDKLHDKNIQIKKHIDELESITKKNALSDTQFDIIRNLLSSFKNTFDDMSIEQKRLALRTFLRRVEWDGENVHIYLLGEGGNEIDFPGHCSKPKGEHSK
jgi:site-specific DNA recombinase